MARYLKNVYPHYLAKSEADSEVDLLSYRLPVANLPLDEGVRMATTCRPGEQQGLSLGSSEQGYMNLVGCWLPNRLKQQAIIVTLSTFLFGCSRQEPSKQPAATSTSTPPSASPSAQFGGGACEVASLAGFHPAESWGAWSAKDPAEIVLTADLRGAVNVKFSGYTFNDGTPHDLKISIGDTTRTIKLTSDPKTFDLDYSLSVPARNIILTGVTPRSPPNDERLLGVGFIRLDCAAK